MDLTNPKVIKSILSRFGFTFSKSLGQNFLIDPEVPKKMAALCGAGNETGVLEIGPGIGCLTKELLEISKGVTAVEIDERLLPLLSFTLSSHPNLTVVCGDILKSDLTALLRSLPGEKRGVCANLPYYITTPVITKLISEAPLFDFLCVMVQKEVAMRICAAPGTKDYGAFTLFCEYFTDARILFFVPKESFLPSPKIDSAVVLMKIRKIPPVSPQDPKWMFKIIRASFSQRRKTFKNSVLSALPSLSAEQIENALRALEKQEKVRGEELSLQEFSQISDALLS